MLGRPTSSGSAAKRPRLDDGGDSRPICPYGSRCYRKNPDHLRDFVHPSGPSSDHEEPSTSSSSDLPPCKYGANCYRKNLLHFAQFSHPFDAPVDESESESDGDARGDENENGAQSDATEPLSSDEDTVEDGKNGNLVKRGLSLVRHYSSMNEEERRELVRQAIEAKCTAEDRLEELRERVRDKEDELERLRNQFSEAGLLLKGEEEAMKMKDKVTYFPLYASRQYKAGSAAEIHFRLAESQFYRLLTGESMGEYRVSKVEYVVSPKLIENFKNKREQLSRERGETLSYPVLAFHGTTEEAISSICKSGFLVPGDRSFVASTDAGYYGRGVYFSEFPSYSMGYIRGGTKLLLCQVVLGKVFRCTGLRHGQPLEDGFDSHASPDKKELIIFSAAQILPCYVIHYSNSASGFRYELTGAEREELRSRWQQAKKKRKSSVMKGSVIQFTGDFTMCSNNDLHEIVRKHQGKIGSDKNFNILISTQEVFDSLSPIVKNAIDKKVPCVHIGFLLDSINEGKKVDIENYGLL